LAFGQGENLLAFGPRRSPFAFGGPALAALTALALSVAGALASPALAGRTPARVPTKLKAISGVGSLSLSWGVHGWGVHRTAGLTRWRLRWRRLTAPMLPWTRPKELPARAHTYKIAGLTPGTYEVRIRAVLSGARLGGLASVRAKPLAKRPAKAGKPSTAKGTSKATQAVPSPVGTNYYVSPTGSDKNPGTSIALPWRTVGRVNSATLKGGDAVLFQGGAAFADTNLVGNAGGEPGRPITYGSYGSGKADIKWGLWDAGHDFLTFENLEVNNGDLSESEGFGGRGSDVTVENSTMLNVESGIFVVAGNRWDVLDDVIERTGNSGMLTQTDAEGGSTPPGEGWVIDGNVINQTGLVNFGYAEHGIYLKCRDSEVAHNTITNFAVDGISQRYGGATVVANKISGGGTGIAFFPYDDQAHTSVWAENEVVGTETGFYAPATDPGSPPPGGTTLESFVLSKNIIGPLKGGSEDWIDMHTTGTITEPGGNTLR
jgi:Right handed beta helix region